MEIVELIIIFACLTVSFLLAKLMWWFWLMFAICLLVAITELIAKIKTGHTISQMFWKWSEENRGKAWLIIGSLLLSWLVLLYHLSKKMIFGGKK